ncbi:hypothetical protein [Roseibium litorale]|uniref:Secreted protein n=1 Tax=Roseibium litorale TaxID=2803841 RepID=A0ABR9CNT6_9HYPH|nr:hypothetical protein [Roseibium litorale]MBD8892398.1 hypothetical protein [Roseibium litorale]
MIALIKFLLRFAGTVLFAMALVAMVSDGTKSIARSEVVVTSVRQIWEGVSVQGPETVKESVTTSVDPEVWDVAVEPVLSWPLWLVALLAGSATLWLGSRRRARQPRYF